MPSEDRRVSSRRAFLSTTGKLAAASALAGTLVPRVHAAGDDVIELALVGCGGRGTGAAADALSADNARLKLVAMADIFPQRLAGSYGNLANGFKDQVDVPEDRRFVGFDAYRKAIDCLKPGGIVALATPPAFRWVHFGYAVQKGVHTFMEKPVTVDGPSTRRMFELAADADRKNLKVGVGLMVRHCRGRRELKDRIEKGELGDLMLLRATRMHGWAATLGRKPQNISEVLYQVRHFHSFLWSGGGLFSDYNIHQIDECSWMKGAWPVKAFALGGRHYRGENVDQNLDTYAVEYTFPDGTKFMFCGRYISGCYEEFASFAHGTKGSAVISTSAHTPGRVRIYNNQTFDGTPAWAFPQPEPNPYRMEWVDLVEAIVNQPYNEAKRGAEASLVTAMGRMAAHTGRIITYDEMLNCDHELAPDVDKLTDDGPAPLTADTDGKYPVPMPGVNNRREY